LPRITGNVGLWITNRIGGSNSMEIRGTNNSSSAFGPEGGLHIGGLSAVGPSNAVIEGSVGIGTNDPKAVLHISPGNTNKMIQFADLGFGGLYPGGGAFTFYNWVGTNGANTTFGWTATSTLINAPTTGDLLANGTTQWRWTTGDFSPSVNNTDDFGKVTAMPRTNYANVFRGTNATLVGTLTAASGTFQGGGTNGMDFLSVTNGVAVPTNAAPSTVTVGVTAPDLWLKVKDITTGYTFYTPCWTNH
jgi:hypothetical protein